MISLFLPRFCPCCQRAMLPQEEGVCLRCLGRLPRVHAEQHDNAVEARLVGRFPFEHATSFCYYTRPGSMSSAVMQAKYADRPWINTHMARLFARELSLFADPPSGAVPASSQWPFDIDVIVPIPVHPLRLMWRGYNQAAAVAEGLRDVWHLPIESRCLIRSRYLRTQVGLSGQERILHEAGSFTVSHPQRLASRHVLLVDDVLTTGSTMVAAADALLSVVPGVRISVLTLAMAE